VLHGVVVIEEQDLAFGLAESHTVGLGPSIQPDQVPLQRLHTLQQINTPTQPSVTCKLTEGALNPLIQIIDKDVNQDQQKQALASLIRSLRDHCCCSVGPGLCRELFLVARLGSWEAEYLPGRHHSATPVSIAAAVSLLSPLQAPPQGCVC